MVITSQDESNINTILDEILKHKFSIEFAYPVDYIGLQLLDYPNIIKKPMDISTIRKNLEDKIYTSPEAALDDIQLIWDNCKIYNIESSYIYEAATKVEKHADKIIKKYYKKYKKTVKTLADLHEK